MLIRLSQPSGSVITLADMKKRLREESADNDELIGELIKAATARAEKRTGRVLLPADFEWRAGAWWSDFRIPVVPVRTVTEVRYLNAAHAEVVLEASTWRSERDDRGAMVRLENLVAYPVLSTRELPIRVRFSAGHDAAGTNVTDPELAQNPLDVQMVAMLVAHWFRTRESASAENLNGVPAGFDVLAAERRIYW